MAALAARRGRGHGLAMLRMGLVAALMGAALALSGCGQGARGQATDAVQRFLAAVHADDRAAFEAMIDRPALRSDLRGQLLDLGRTSGLEVDGGASEFALDRMITPRAFQLVEAGTGKPLADAPKAEQIERLVRIADRDHACVGAADPNSPCILSFAKQDGHWRLVGMRADQLTLAVDPASVK